MSLPKLLIGPWLTLLLFAFAFAGCLSSSDGPQAPDTENGSDDQEAGDGTGNGDDGAAGAEDGDPDNENDEEDEPQEEPAEEETCTVAQENLTGWNHDGLAVPSLEGDPAVDPLVLLAQISNESFDVPAGTEVLIVTASAGDHVTLGWEVSLIDPTGSSAYSFTGEAGPGVEGVTGEAIQETGSVVSPQAGAWTLQATVTGYVEGLTIQVDANVCR